jgi:uncharacterized protein (DUF924 family)
MNANNILNFWFEELSSEDWYKKSTELDNTIRERFLPLHLQATKGELFSWRTTIEGRLAEIILLDQFSRNMFRDKPEAFAYDSLALILSQEASLLSDVYQLVPSKRAFLFLPFMHSESLAIHEKAVSLFSAKGLELSLEFELKHKVIIERFGRYPHRNEILGRASTREEVEFLKEENSSF